MEESKKSKPPKLWLVVGHHPSSVARAYNYDTDPRQYDLPNFQAMSDEEYLKVANQLKVFRVAAHAIDFCYDCGLELTHCTGFKLVDGSYVVDQAVTDEVMNIDW